MKNLIFLFLAMFLVAGCSKKVSRIDDKKQVDLSGRWNDTDSRLVSEEIIKDALQRNWANEFTEAKGKKPAIVVGIVKNKSSEHISTETFIKDIEREFINSGKVKIIQGTDNREQLRQERGAQKDFASPATTKKWGEELGADYILQGTLNTITDANANKKLMYYQIDLELTDIETNEKVWIGTKKIKKIIK